MTEYYSRVNANENTLRKDHPDGFCLVISTKPRNNGPVEVTTRNAAVLLTDGGFRLATEAEDQAFRATQTMARTESPVTAALEAARVRFAALTSGKDGH